jgi:hypothetical protein
MSCATLKHYHQSSRLTHVFWLMAVCCMLVWPVTLRAEGKETSNNEMSSLPAEEQAFSEGGFSISLTLYNPATGKPQSTFFFGDEAGYEALLTIPPTAEGKKTTVTLTASVKVGGVTLPFTTSHVFSGPMTNPTYKKDVDLFEPRIWNGKFKMPKEIPVPELTATVKLVVTIKDIGTSTINKKITLKTRRTLPSPTLSYPEEGASLSVNSSGCSTSLYRTYWYFSWNDVPWATKYELTIQDNFNGSTFTYETDRHSYWSQGPCTDSNHKSWTWKVRAGNEYSWSNWSGERHFTVNYPGPPGLIDPLEGAVMDNGCNPLSNPITWFFDWSDIPGVSCYNLVVISLVHLPNI